MRKDYHNCLYSIDLSSDKKIELTKNEFIELYYQVEKFFELKDKPNPFRPSRQYNKREKIISLYEKYKTHNKTKADVFREISKELKITYKAVEKAFYQKR